MIATYLKPLKVFNNILQDCHVLCKELPDTVYLMNARNYLHRYSCAELLILLRKSARFKYCDSIEEVMLIWQGDTIWLIV